MAKFRFPAISELTHQLRLSPSRLRLKQLEAAEYLVDLIEADKSYPYDFVVHHVTGHRPKVATQQKPMPGKLLVQDLVQLIEELSAATPLPVHLMPGPVWTAEELAARLKVSTKTICRWRHRGLCGRKLRYPDNTVRMSFLESSVRRFITRNIELVRRGAAFKQLTAAEKQQIIELARELLAERRMRLHELSQAIAARMGRAVETVRYTLRRYDQAHPEEGLLGSERDPAIKPEFQQIYNEVRAGANVADVAARYRRSVTWVQGVVREVRARMLKARELHYIYNPEFDAPNAEEMILRGTSTDDVEPEPKRARPPRDLPPYLQDLYRQPLLTPTQERDLFRRYNYLKYRADMLRKKLEPVGATDEEMDAIEALLAQAEEVKNEILRANLRLVVSIARRHVGKSACFFEIVSDGNLSLMRAVEKFDYARGFKFSTYASWAIMRNYARTVPEQMYHAAKLVTGVEETLAAAPARGDAGRSVVIEAAQHLVQKGLDLLTERERDIIVRHYGLEKDSQPMTLDQIGRIFGVTKERVRQIERKAFMKLRAALDGGEIAGALDGAG